MKKIIIINGPNLNLLGNREQNVYGNDSLEDIKKIVQEKCSQLDIECFFCQSNNEGEIISFIQLADKDYDGLIINPAAFTHSSVSIRDALAAMKIPFIEVHISNVFSREDFRKHSFFSDIAIGVISGLGTEGYFAALNYVAKLNK